MANAIIALSLITCSTPTESIIKDIIIMPKGAKPMHVTNTPKLYPLLPLFADLKVKAPCIVLKPDKHIPPKHKNRKPITNELHIENKSIPKKNPIQPIRKKIDNLF